MLMLVVFLLSTFWSAWVITSMLASRDPEPLSWNERGIWTAILGLGLWLGQGWILAFTGHFRSVPLLLSSILLAVLVLAAARKRNTPLVPRAMLQSGASRFLRGHGAGLFLGLVAIWLLYSVVAMWVIPVSNHDALSYHFPKAAWLSTTGQFDLYPSNDGRVSYYPLNYEMLTATFMSFLHSDSATGLLSPALLLLFLATSLSLFQRVWGPRAASLSALPLLLGSPVILLQSTAHKNDLLMAALSLNALMWMGRYATQGGTGSAIVGLVAFALALGTKFHGLFLVLASTLLLWQAWRRGIWRPTPRQVLYQVVGLGLLLILLGGGQYALNLFRTGHLMGLEQISTPNAMNTVAFPAYWQIPRFLWMFLLAPVCTYGQYFHVPWNGARWFWPSYELYFSHFGIHVSLLLLLLPLGIKLTRSVFNPSALTELKIISFSTLVLVGLNLLIGLRPYGSFSFIPRFLIFGLPILLTWTWCPIVHYCETKQRLVRIFTFISLIVPIGYISVTLVQDRFTPLKYVGALWAHPELRRETWHSSWRAASFVDRNADPRECVAFDGNYDGWVYPLFGSSLSRKVKVIPESDGEYVPSEEIRWVAIDHAFTIIWGHPDFHRMDQATEFIDRGKLSGRELRVFNSLNRNPKFKLVYFFPSRFQAVFVRVK